MNDPSAARQVLETLQTEFPANTQIQRRLPSWLRPAVTAAAACRVAARSANAAPAPRDSPAQQPTQAPSTTDSATFAAAAVPLPLLAASATVCRLNAEKVVKPPSTPVIAA